MLEDILKAVQKPNPAVVEALTNINGCFCDIYERLSEDEYSNARGVLASNGKQYSSTPTYSNEKLLVYMPVQETYAGTPFGEQFDAYLKEDTYIITHKTQLDLHLYQKVVVKFGSSTRTHEIFKCDEIDGINGAIIKIAYLSPLT